MRWQRRAARGVPSCRCCVISVLNCCETGRRRRIRRSLPLRHAPAKSLKFARSTRQTQPSLTLSSGQPFCSRWRRLTDGEGERSVGAAVLASPTDRPASARHTHLHSSRSSRISHESATVLGVFFLSVRIRCRLSPGQVAGSVRFARPAGSTSATSPPTTPQFFNLNPTAPIAAIAIPTIYIVRAATPRRRPTKSHTTPEQPCLCLDNCAPITRIH